MKVIPSVEVSTKISLGFLGNEVAAVALLCSLAKVEHIVYNV